MNDGFPNGPKAYHVKKNTKTGEVIGDPVALVGDKVFIDNWDWQMAHSPIRWVPIDQEEPRE